MTIRNFETNGVESISTGNVSENRKAIMSVGTHLLVATAGAKGRRVEVTLDPSDVATLLGAFAREFPNAVRDVAAALPEGYERPSVWQMKDSELYYKTLTAARAGLSKDIEMGMT